MSHNLTTLALSRLRPSVTTEVRVRTRIILFGIRDDKDLQYALFSPCTIHSLVIKLTLTLRTQTLTTVHPT